jgi:hypothetical protein
MLRVIGIGANAKGTEVSGGFAPIFAPIFALK